MYFSLLECLQNQRIPKIQIRIWIVGAEIHYKTNI